MANPVSIEKVKLEKEPYLIWNTFIDMVATNELDDLNDIQSVAQCAFKYDSEVQNGGHLQFFENLYSGDIEQLNVYITLTLEALKILGAKKQGKILSDAAKKYFKERRKHPSTVEEFVELEEDGEFEKYDNKYYECSPDINSYLEKYLQLYQNEFVEIVP